MQPSFPERAFAIRRATARLCLRLGWAPLHEVALPNGRRADILALRPDGCFACIEVKSGPRDFLTDLKWQDYREFADELFFAVDADFPQDLLPAETGLIVAAGLEEHLQPAGVTVIEWAERWFDPSRDFGSSTHGFPALYRRVHIETLGETERRIDYEDFGS